MHARPRDLADQMADMPQPQIFTLPLDVARCKAREIIDQSPQSGFTPVIEKWRTPVIEKWRQLPDGQIELAIRHLPAAD